VLAKFTTKTLAVAIVCMTTTTHTIRMSTLHCAVQFGDLEQVERCLIDTDPNIPGPLGWTPLHIAAMTHCSVDLPYMLEKDLLSLRDDDDRIVVQSRRRCIVRVLLDKGADPKIKDCNGKKALHLLDDCNDDEMRTLLGGKPKSKK